MSDTNFGKISGIKWNDLNGNGFRDSELIQGNNPEIIFTIDVSGSAEETFEGTSVGDINGDEIPDTRLDAQLKGFIDLNNQLIAQGLGDTAEVGIVVFSGFSEKANMNLVTNDEQLTINPNTDANSNGINDVEEILTSITSGAFGVGNDTGTNFEVALQEVNDTFERLGTVAGNGNVVFLSDGEPVKSGDFTNEVTQLNAKGVNISAFGVGQDASLDDLKLIDPDATRFTTTDELLGVFGNISSSGGASQNSPIEPGLAGVTVYLDQNNNGVLDDGELSQVTASDDPNTPDINETGYYEFTDLAAGDYTVREMVPTNFVQTFPTDNNGTHTVTLGENQVVEELNFGNFNSDSTNPSGKISGIKWNDLNGNGFRDSELIQGNNPEIIFTIDVSDSAEETFEGTSVGDVNGDGDSNNILDAELAGFIALNQQLIEQGLGDIAEVGIVAFAGSAVQVDMNPAVDGVQLTTTANADNDNNGVKDVEQILSSIVVGAFGVSNFGTDFEAALQGVQNTFSSLGTVTGNGNVVFLSDGEPVESGDFTNEVTQLNAKGVNISAFGVGQDASLNDLKLIDPDATRFTTTDELLGVFGNISSSGGASQNSPIEPGLAGVTVYLDQNNNGVLDDGELSQVTASDDPNTPNINETGYYEFTNLAAGDYIVRELVPAGSVQTFPTDNNGTHTVTLGENQVVEELNFGNFNSDSTNPLLTNIKFTLANNDTEKVNEVGVFVVDDENGNIDGNAFNSKGYLEAALQRSEVIFSAVANRPNGFDLGDIERVLEVDSEARLGFYLISEGTTDTALTELEAGATDLPIFFPDFSNLQVSDLAANSFNLNWSDQASVGNLTDIELNIEVTEDALRVGTQLQGQPQNELIDLSNQTGSVTVSVEVYREAAFDNLIGFYQVIDSKGGIDVDGDGVVDFNPDDAGYKEAALANRVTGLNLLQTDDQQTTTFDGTVDGGSILASFIVVDGTVDDALNNSAEVYFSFLGANSDGVDHIRLLGDNTFGYEDLNGGGDNDFNDMIIKVDFPTI